MRKLSIIIIVAFSYVVSLYGQTTFSASFKPISQDERTKVMEAYAQTYKSIETKIDNLSNTILDYLNRSIDSQLRNELNSDLKELDSIMASLEKDGDLSKARTGVSSAQRKIHSHIAQYNSRAAASSENGSSQSSSNSSTMFPSQSKIKRWSGSGFALKDNYIVTNYHVIENATEIIVRGVKGDFDESYSAEVAATDVFHDLAILKVKKDFSSKMIPIPYSIKTEMSDVGEDVYVLGYPLTATMGDEIKYTTGVVSSRSGYQGMPYLYQISAPIQPGNSGGPLFDAKGNIIGVVTASHDNTENVGYAVKSSYIVSLATNRLSKDIIPTNNEVSKFARTSQIKLVKNFVFLIDCTGDTTN